MIYTSTTPEIDDRLGRGTSESDNRRFDIQLDNYGFGRTNTREIYTAHQLTLENFKLTDVCSKTIDKMLTIVTYSLLNAKTLYVLFSTRFNAV